MLTFVPSLSEWWTKTFTALQFPHFRRYWFSQMFSLVGGWVQMTAQQYLVLELSGGSSTALGWVTVAQFIPSLLLSLFAGAVVDRVSRRRVLISTQVTVMCTSLILAICTHQEIISVPLVMALAFVSGISLAFDMPARQSMVVDFVPRKLVSNAVALNSLNFNVSRTIGQALFGFIAALGVYILAGGNDEAISRLAFPFYVNTLSFLVVIYVIATLPFPKRDQPKRNSVLEDIKEGLRYVRGTPSVKNVMFLVAAFSMTIINFNVILPYYAREVFGAKEFVFGLLSASFGIGAMVGALWQASKPNPLRNIRIGALMLLAGAILLALSPSAWVAAPVFAGCGAAMMTFLISANSSVQLTIPDHLRGRVMSLYSFVLLGMLPVGALMASNMINQEGFFGARWGVIVLAGLGGAALLLLWRRLPRIFPKQEEEEKE